MWPTEWNLFDQREGRERRGRVHGDGGEARQRKGDAYERPYSVNAEFSNVHLSADNGSGTKGKIREVRTFQEELGVVIILDDYFLRLVKYVGTLL